MARSRNNTGKQQQVRIIGGQWRGRKLSFTPAEGLRPTGDRVRETLFNWLAVSIQGARCVDLFTGSGALGLEALSRGANYCDFVDSSNTTLNQVSNHLKTLDAQDHGLCHLTHAEQFVRESTQPYDIVFIDPPFHQQLVEPVCRALHEKKLLNCDALVYIEMGAAEPAPDVPCNWNLHREKVSGDVAYRLFSIT